ncbi:hypothetical protein [Segetibacter aerophilus]|uniref:Uncharacterized protein n=1 Tax=Segetibacter aerophilus TaxID=670293 RepID=A0A512B8N8_9BACT|nr:hypothetical protein [Segetibacter aerophilus]GEO08313.1 hypothetical protein SAE01_08090 [Segetibacter aerophilus]
MGRRKKPFSIFDDPREFIGRLYNMHETEQYMRYMKFQLEYLILFTSNCNNRERYLPERIRFKMNELAIEMQEVIDDIENIEPINLDEIFG